MRNTLIALLFACSTAAGVEVAKISVQPSEIVVTAEGRAVLVTGVTAEGHNIDLSADAEFTVQGDGVKLGDDGRLYPQKKGVTMIQVKAGGHETTLKATVSDLESSRAINFIRDLMPVINRTGCTAGSCHGSQAGKNGFKLSLRGYDPEYDYRSLLFDVSGRRFNRAAPGESLMLTKPVQDVPHEGGLRFEKDSRYFETIYNWIAEGVAFGDPEKDDVAELEVLPTEIFMPEPGLEQRLLVTAKYRDGSIRDVTREAMVESNVPTIAEIAEVDESSAVKGVRVGEAALMVRYAGKFVTIPVTILNSEPGFEFQKLTQLNFIDEQIDAKLARLKIQPSPLADDATFVRRVYIDLTGIPPTPAQAREFLDEPENSQVKRRRLIDSLIGSKGFVDHWSLKWGDLLQSNRKFLGEKGTWAFRQWIQDSIAENKRYDEWVKEMLTSVGSTYQNPATNFFRVNDDPKRAMENTTQIFLGVRMVCAQCHDHPFERWTQNQYYQLAAFFGAVGIKPGFSSDEQIVFLKRDDNEIKHPNNGQVVEPEYLIASAGAPPVGSLSDRREELAEWLTSEKNPFFAQAITNRLWSYFFSRGIIDPVDDIRASNPPVNKALLDALADDFVEHGFDLQHVVRTIVSSRTYQASISTNKWNEGDETNFSHFIPKRLAAESILDAMTIATGSRPKFEEVPEDFTAQQLPDPHVGRGGFLDMFGRPERESACECERRSDMSLPQAMNLVNGPTLAEAIADPEGRVAEAILAGRSDRELVEELYLASMTRLPTATELDKALTYLRGGNGRAARAQDLLWALVNSNAFLFNR
jgi:hypothetical protein